MNVRAINTFTENAELERMCYDKELTAIRLSVFFGPWALDQFYIGHWGLGYLKLFSLGGLGLWTLIDVILWIRGGVYMIPECVV